ncbi:MAG: NAD-dependent epimerase/dehydratase family protein [Spartobacteria bacterium]
MKVVITGGAGFIGSHLAEHYQGKASVVVLDNFRTGHRSNLDGVDCRVVRGSILDEELVAEVVDGADYVFHLAALVSVPESMSQMAETVRLNVLGLINVLEASRRARVKKLCFASSAAVYGENPADLKTEALLPDPRSPYAITKLDGEYYCELFRREGWLNTASVRFFNVFGPRQDPKGPYAAAVPIFISRAVAGEPLVVYGDGGQTRDFIYVKDIVGALAFLAETPGASGAFNAGYGGSMSILDLAKLVVERAGSNSPINHAEERAGDIRHSMASPARLQAAGWKPAHGFASGLDETIRFYSASKP